MAKPKQIVSLQQFKAAAVGDVNEQAVAGGVVVRVAMSAEVKAAEGGERAIDFVLSTDSIDRQGDSIDQAGWQLANFRKNPAVCWAHDYQSLPVGKAKNVRIEDGKLKARCEFTAEGKIRFNDLVFDLCRDGFLNACSVGFIPLEWNWAESEARRMGMDFHRQDLLEFSIVPVPANPEALIERGLAELDPDGLMSGWAAKLLALPDDFAARLAAVDPLREEASGLRTEIKDLRAEVEGLKSVRQTRRPPPQKEFSRLAPRALELARLKGSV